jgi:N-acetylmuramoyl-L-alanine amidase
LAFLLSSCASTGRNYGPGAGFFDTVVVDAGHGGHDDGARARTGSYEKTLTLDTARRLAARLRGCGFHVIETRTSDKFISLPQRVAISNRSGRAVFVSVHYNWTQRRAARGIEIYYNSRRSMRLAANILKDVLGAYRTNNRGIKSGRYHVLRNNQKPSVLCELGFVSNPKENRLLQSASVRQQLADRIAAGVVAEKAGRQP